MDEFSRHIVKKLGMTVSQLFVSLCVIYSSINIAEYASGENVVQYISQSPISVFNTENSTRCLKTHLNFVALIFFCRLSPSVTSDV